MKSVAIVGAGFAGIATARVLSRLQHDVTVFEAAPDVGGVWSKTRSYPALKTQSPAASASTFARPPYKRVLTGAAAPSQHVRARCRQTPIRRLTPARSSFGTGMAQGNTRMPF